MTALSVILRENRHGMVSQDLAHVDLEGPVGDQFLSHPQAVASSRHLRHAAESELRHDLTDLLRDKEHETADIFRLSLEAAPQCLVLRCNSDRTGIFGTDTHHHASEAYQRRCREAEFLRSKQGCDRHVPAAHELAVCLQNDSVPKTVFCKTPVRLCETLCASVRPSSQGRPALCMELPGAAPVPPS